MNIIMLIIIPVLNILSLYIAFVALRTFLSNPSNSMNAFYWGLSFLLMGLAYPLAMLYTYIVDQSLKYAIFNVASHVDNIVGFMQLTAVLYSTVWCDKFGSDRCAGCGLCKRKLKLAIPVTLMTITTLIGIFLADYFKSYDSMSIVTTYYAIIHFIVISIIVYSLFKYRIYGLLLAIPYCVVILVNILLPVAYILKIDSSIIEPIVFGLVNSSALILMIEVLKIIDGLGFRKLK